MAFRAKGHRARYMRVTVTKLATENGQYLFALAEPMVHEGVRNSPGEIAPERRDYGLTERESTALELMGAGLAKKQSADRLNLNRHTVDYTMRRIHRKLHVSCAPAVVSLALRERLI